MTKAEVARLLAAASAIDSRRVTEAMVEAWSLVVGDLPLIVAQRALAMHWRESTDWVMPAHILQRAPRARRQLELERDADAQVRWLAVLGLTLDDYLARVEEPGWLEAMQLTHDALVAQRELKP